MPPMCLQSLGCQESRWWTSLIVKTRNRSFSMTACEPPIDFSLSHSFSFHFCSLPYMYTHHLNSHIVHRENAWKPVKVRGISILFNASQTTDNRPSCRQAFHSFSLSSSLFTFLRATSLALFWPLFNLFSFPHNFSTLDRPSSTRNYDSPCFETHTHHESWFFFAWNLNRHQY